MKHMFFLFCLTLSLLSVSTSTYAELNPRVKAMGVMAGYGTIGGALLGTASLAFGGKPRSIAIGSSLGLYTGLLFGSYVILSHVAQQKGWNAGTDYYPETAPSPYEGGYSEPISDQVDPAANYRSDPLKRNQAFFAKKKWEIGIPLLNFSF